MGVFSISSHHGTEAGAPSPASSPTSKNFQNSPTKNFQKAARKISVPLSFYSNSHSSNDHRNLEEAEAASDRKSLFSAVKFPSISSTKFHNHHTHHTVSPIKVQVSPAEPSRTNVTSIPSTVRITRRHTEHAGTIRKFTPPMQMPPITFLQPPAVPSVSSFPEPVVLHRPTPIPEESMEEIESAPTTGGGGVGIPSLPATSYRFKLPPLQVSHSTLISTNRAPDFGINDNNPEPPPFSKPMTSVSEPMRNKAASFALESPNRVSKYRVFFKCFFVVLFLSIPVVIFVVMMALSGGFSPFQASNNSNSSNNKTILNSNSSISQIFTTTFSSLPRTTTTNDLWLNDS